MMVFAILSWFSISLSAASAAPSFPSSSFLSSLMFCSLFVVSHPSMCSFPQIMPVHHRTALFVSCLCIFSLCSVRSTLIQVCIFPKPKTVNKGIPTATSFLLLLRSFPSLKEIAEEERNSLLPFLPSFSIFASASFLPFSISLLSLSSLLFPLFVPSLMSLFHPSASLSQHVVQPAATAGVQKATPH